MVTENSMELENQAFLSNQDITGEAPKFLPVLLYLEKLSCCPYSL